MRVLRGFCGLMVIGCLAAIGASAQEKVDPQPKSGTVPRGFRMYLVTDARYEKTEERNRVGKLHDPVTEHGLFPVIAVFARTIPTNKEDPVVKVFEKQEEVAKKYETKRLGAFIAFLGLKKSFEDDDDRYKRMTEIGNICKNLKFVQAGLAEEQSAQNTAWLLDAKNEDMTWKNQITVIIYNRFKIVHRWDFPTDKPPTDADLATIGAAVDGLMGRKPMEPKKEVEKKEEPKKDTEKN